MPDNIISTPVFPTIELDYPMPTLKPDLKHDDDREAPLEIAICGDLSEHESDICEKLLSVSPGGECTLYFNSPGGSAYAALSLASMIVLRGMNVTGVVLGECSSAAIWPLAACKRRIVTAHSVLLFHPLKWESGEHVAIDEAAEWARHFAHLEQDMDGVLARLFNMPAEKLAAWMKPGRYVSGHELAAAGLAEMVDLVPQMIAPPPPQPGGKRKRK
jgi:ATP-dependent protease ClpP protease subunit